jgi:hypothetical protein
MQPAKKIEETSNNEMESLKNTPILWHLPMGLLKTSITVG